ncbi:hypothetical protein DICPUDRAFT_34032 [Dictyostelium purpureum]|uniref:Dolichyl-diphosphooligosaccharide-protein glycosyltransferase subunit OST5 n=1 Tax=Dictyostelium purpureum TaxID=5786 RepID=F0ZLW4_DICPU|nr:uncharacterized protein DICPUDRAFT_34032 [Dictyostelium purpureum]EGC35038.1 hypothetical protein DICPUDRAFT_34032 [Dictyostelium purpureum]|eukprot:XP_003288406.1 hypothetical protein DICPUDRAFT_34032 [Dictyostelium purpureum]
MALTPYYSPVDPTFYPLFAFLFSAVGLAFLAVFIMSELTSKRGGKNIFSELTMALVASCTLGLGGFFVLLSAGIYV